MRLSARVSRKIGEPCRPDIPTVEASRLWICCGNLDIFQEDTGCPMKLVAATIILFMSTEASFAGNFTPIPKNKLAQTPCATSCQVLFDTCARLRAPPPPPATAGTQQVAPQTPSVVIGPNCEFEQAACLRACVTSPRG